MRPFGHDSIIEAIHEAVFKLQEGPARLHPILLDPMPFETIAFAAVVVCIFSLKKYLLLIIK